MREASLQSRVQLPTVLSLFLIAFIIPVDAVHKTSFTCESYSVRDTRIAKEGKRRSVFCFYVITNYFIKIIYYFIILFVTNKIKTKDSKGRKMTELSTA